MKNLFFFSCILGGLAGCSAVTKESDTFLASVSLKDGVYAWQPGTGSSLDNYSWSVSSIAVQNGGRTIMVYTSDTPSIRYIFTYDSPISTDRAYYRNAISYTPAGAAAPLKAVRYAGIRVYNGRLVWAGYTEYPKAPDWAALATQADFDAFNIRFWGKDKIRFTSEYAVLGL